MSKKGDVFDDDNDFNHRIVLVTLNKEEILVQIKRDKEDVKDITNNYIIVAKDSGINGELVKMDISHIEDEINIIII